VRGPGKDTPRIERILLIGFMGSGKTRVGEVLAGRLNWSFLDLDQEISSRAGLSIPDLFSQHGEAFFRKMEEKVGADLLLERDVVLATGGGWPVVPGRMESLGPETFSVWLQVSVEEAVRRVSRDGPTRPLLAVDDPGLRAETLLTEREPFYRKAQVVIDATKAGPEEISRTIENLMNEKGRGGFGSLPPYK
jgi:shikimate kinase